jgi:hypothetical protein
MHQTVTRDNRPRVSSLKTLTASSSKRKNVLPEGPIRTDLDLADIHTS